MEEAKNNFFASVFNKLADTQMEQKSVTTKFVGKLGTQFEKDAAKAHERMVAIEKTKNRETLANAGYIVGNAVKLWTLTSGAVTMPLRAIAMGGMVFARGADAAKEVRFENEKVIEKTRIDEDKAWEEAEKIYAKKARKKGMMSAKEIENTYRGSLPKDILARLEAKTPEQPGLVNRMVQWFIKGHIERSVKRLERKSAKIDENDKLTAKEKNAKRERLFNRFGRRLRDYDRAVGQLGTVDALAMGLRYAEMTGKVATYAPAVHVALEKGFEVLGGLFERSEVVDALEDARDAAVSDPAAVVDPGTAPKMQEEIIQNLKELARMPGATEAAPPDALRQAPLTEDEVEFMKEMWTETEVGQEQMKLATVGKGEGVTHAIKRQLMQHAEQYGYTKESGDMDRWAVLKSKEIAMENGYIKPDGTEIRVLDQGPKENPAYILEKDASGKLKVAEYLEGKPTGGAGVKNAYEYEWEKPAYSAEKAPPVHEIAEMPMKLERVLVTELPPLKLEPPEWLTERIEYAKLAETLPEKAANL